MEITYKFNKQDKVGVCFLFEPTIRGVKVTDHNDYVFVNHETEEAISISIGKHIAEPYKRATLSWSNWNTKDGGEIEFADKFHHCLETAILIASLINAHYKKGN
jgi:hypothetical protein